MNKDRAKYIPHIIYLIYTIYMTGFAIANKWPSWVPATIMFGVAVSFCGFAVWGKNSKSAKVLFAVMVWMNVVIYTFCVKSSVMILPSIATVVVMLSLFDTLTVNYICVFMTALLTIYNHITLRTVDFHNIMQFAAVFLLEYVEIMVLKDRLVREKDLEKSIREQKIAERGKDDFMANISHEIRTPLNILCGTNEILMDKEMDDETYSSVYDSYIAGQNLKNLVSDIIDFTELSNDTMTTVEEAYNLTSVINDAINICNSKNKDKHLEFIVDCQANIPGKLIGDSQKIYRALMHVLDNAFKFTEEGGVTLSIAARKEAYGINLIFEVEDTGIGIKSGDIENLERVYNQIDTKRDRTSSGVGLGLAISKKIIEKMNGFIHVESKFGEGTKVVFTIPQKVASDEKIVSLENARDIFILFYLDLDKYKSSAVRDSYLKCATHITKQLDIGVFRCNSQAELERRAADKAPSHILTAYEEYLASKKYYDEMAKKLTVVLVADTFVDASGVSKNIKMLYKPFQVFSLASILSGKEITIGGKDMWNVSHKFSAMDAKVLVVDDSSMNLSVAGAMLKKYGIHIERALSGKEAIDKVNGKRYDLIFMDHMMPEMDGVECFHRIKELPSAYAKEIPIVALTANAVSGAREMMLNEGFDDFVAKPIERNELERVLRKFLWAFIQDELELQEEKPEQSAISAKEPEKQIAEETTLLQETPETVAETSAEAERIEGSLLWRLEGFDWDEALSKLGDEEVLVETIKVFYDSLDETKEKLESFINTIKSLDSSEEEKEKAIYNYRVEVHALKSGAATVGAMEFSKLAKELEMYSKDQDREAVLAKHPGLMENLNLYKERLTPMVQTFEDEEGGNN